MTRIVYRCLKRNGALSSRMFKKILMAHLDAFKDATAPVTLRTLILLMTRIVYRCLKRKGALSSRMFKKKLMRHLDVSKEGTARLLHD